MESCFNEFKLLVAWAVACAYVMSNCQCGDYFLLICFARFCLLLVIRTHSYWSFVLPLIVDFFIDILSQCIRHIQLQRHSICIGMESHNASLQYYKSSNTERTRESLLTKSPTDLHVQIENLICNKDPLKLSFS
jgi:hypothetical protein